MPLQLIPPGRRKGNKFYLLRGRVNGRVHEFSARKELDRNAAEKWRVETEAKLRQPAAPVITILTFADGIDAYLDAKRPSLHTCQILDRLKVDDVGKMALDHVRPMHLIAAAHRLHPDCKNATKNREVLTPAASVLHFCAANSMCGYVRVEKLPEDRNYQRRKFGAENQAKLIAAARVRNPALWRLLVFIAYQGWRISETLGLDWSHVDLARGATIVRVGKARTWKTIRLADETVAALETVPAGERRGQVFPFKDRWRVRHALEPVLRETGLHFTPHMARHDFATDLNAAAATANDIKDLSTWTSTEAIRDHYIHTDEAHAKALLKRLPKRGVA